MKKITPFLFVLFIFPSISLAAATNVNGVVCYDNAQCDNMLMVNNPCCCLKSRGATYYCPYGSTWSNGQCVRANSASVTDSVGTYHIEYASCTVSAANCYQLSPCGSTDIDGAACICSNACMGGTGQI